MISKIGIVSVSLLMVLAFLPASATSMGAEVSQPNDGCTLLDSNGNGIAGLRTHQVTTPSGNTKMTCKASQDPIDTAVTFTIDDFPGLLCGIGGVGTTDDWHNTIDTDGTITLQCFIKHNA